MSKRWRMYGRLPTPRASHRTVCSTSGFCSAGTPNDKAATAHPKKRNALNRVAFFSGRRGGGATATRDGSVRRVTLVQIGIGTVGGAVVEQVLDNRDRWRRELGL